MPRLNVKQIEAAKHTEVGFATLRDDDGLELRVRSSGSKTWVMRYQFQGKRYIPKIGDYPAMTLKEARDRVADMRKLLDRNIEPMAHELAERDKAEQERKEAEREHLAKIEAERIERESRRLLRPTVERWIELEITRRKGDAAKEMLRSYTKDIFPMLGERELGGIKRGDLMDVLDTIKARDANIQANRTLTSLKQFFNWCVMREYIEANPLALVKKAKVGGVEQERERVLSESEIQELRDKLTAAGLERSSELVLWLQLSTVTRIGEIMQARWEQIDFSAGTWTIPASNAKNSRQHIVYLSEFAQRQFEELRRIHHWSDWVMPSTKKDGFPVCAKSITKQVKDRQTDAPLSGRSKAVDALILSGGTWTPHDLRRTGASLMRSMGASVDTIERCLNHAEQNKMVRTYQRADLSGEMRQAWARLGERIDELLNGTERKVLPFIRVA